MKWPHPSCSRRDTAASSAPWPLTSILTSSLDIRQVSSGRLRVAPERRPQRRRRLATLRPRLSAQFYPTQATKPLVSKPQPLLAPTSVTSRVGTDPATSVADINCKAHELDNLYLVDASFMPSIGAVNPALTVMANAIRVGEHLLDRLR
ncbi:MAG TPA: GMC oxidoreductase [Streptosporangiaceae bacterium]